MKDLLTGTTRIGRRSAPATAAAAVALSLGAYSGYAATLGAHDRERHTFVASLVTRAATLTPGASVRLQIVVHRHGFRRSVSFRIASKLPRGMTARFAPTRTSGKRAVLTLRASTGVAVGRYGVRIRAVGGHVRRMFSLTVKVVKLAAAGQSRGGPVPPFSITGNAPAPLEPGVPQAIDVLITNPNDLPLTISSLTVAVQGISAPGATAALPCAQGDFTVQQLPGALPLTIPASSSRSLSGLGVPASQWPEIALLDLASNQDGCQGASLSLTYTADARLG